MVKKFSKKYQHNAEENASDVPEGQDFKNGEHSECQGIKYEKDIQEQKGNEIEKENQIWNLCSKFCKRSPRTGYN